MSWKKNQTHYWNAMRIFYSVLYSIRYHVVVVVVAVVVVILDDSLVHWLYFLCYYFWFWVGFFFNARTAYNVVTFTEPVYSLRRDMCYGHKTYEFRLFNSIFWILLLLLLFKSNSYFRCFFRHKNNKFTHKHFAVLRKLKTKKKRNVHHIGLHWIDAMTFIITQ